MSEPDQPYPEKPADLRAGDLSAAGSSVAEAPAAGPSLTEPVGITRAESDAEVPDAGPMPRFMDRLGAQPDSAEASVEGSGLAATDSPRPAPVTARQARQDRPFLYPVTAAPVAVQAAALRPRIGEILIRAKRMDLSNVDLVLEQQSQGGGRFGDVALAMGIVDASDLLWALSQQAGLGRPDQRTGWLTGAHADLIVVREPQGAAAEFIRNLRSQLLSSVFRPAAAQRRALAVVSAEAGDGRTYLAANLALSFAQRGGRTMLVDADLRAPRLRRLFGTGAAGGLARVLDGSELLRDAIVSLPDMPNLHLLAGGPIQGSPLELLEQPASMVLVETLTREYEYVIVDTPAARAGADMRVIAQFCGAAMVVARKGRSRMSDVQGLVAQLQKSGVALAGLVMNCH